MGGSAALWWLSVCRCSTVSCASPRTPIGTSFAMVKMYQIPPPENTKGQACLPGLGETRALVFDHWPSGSDGGNVPAPLPVRGGAFPLGGSARRACGWHCLSLPPLYGCAPRTFFHTDLLWPVPERFRPESRQRRLPQSGPCLFEACNLLKEKTG